MEKKLGLCMAGGGFAGFFQVGAYEAFVDAGLKFNMISGTSVGAINGGKIAMGELDALKHLWLTLRRRDFLGGRIQGISRGLTIFRSTSLFPGKYIQEIVKKGAKDKKIKDLEIPLFISATDLRRGKNHVFSGDTLLWEAVVAASAFPGIFPPFVMTVEGRKRIFVDGGVSNNLPLAPLIENGVTDIYVILLQPPIATKHSRFTFVQTVQRSLEILIDNGTLADLRWVDSINTMVENDIEPICSERSSIGLHICKLPKRPRNPFSVGRKERLEMYNLGYQEAQKLIIAEECTDDCKHSFKNN